MKSSARIVRSALAAGTAALVGLAGVLVVPTTAFAAPVSIDDAEFRWAISNETSNSAFQGINLVSAGVVQKADAGDRLTQAEWLATSGAVRLEKPDTAGVRQPATWAGLSTGPDGVTRTSPPTSSVYAGTEVVIGDGVGSLDSASDSATIQWTGSFTVAFYSGLTQFFITDPKLSVENGVGTVTATLGGWGTSMENPDEFTVLETVPNVTIASLSGVDVTDDGIVVTPAYAGVTITPPDGSGPQDLTGTSAGSFPQEFIDFLGGTGQASYWYSSGLSTDSAKVAAPLSVAYTPAEVEEPEVPVDPEDPNVVTGVQLEWAYNRYAHYGVFGAWSQTASAPNVSIGAKPGQVASGNAEDAAKTFKVVRFDGGTGSIDPVTGAGTIRWADTGDWVLNAYNGLYGAPDETLRDPILTINAEGVGTLSFEAYIPAALDMAGNPAPAAGPTRIPLMTFTDATIVDGVLSATPDFAGRAADRAGWQSCEGAGGSWPAEWLNFLPESVQSHYFTTSCSGLNEKKPPLPFSVTLAETAPVIVSQPATIGRNPGQVASFTVTADANPAPTVQWQRSTDGGITFVDIEGATAATYSFAVTEADYGVPLRALISGTTASEVVTVTGDTAPVITTQPAALSLISGDSGSLSVVATSRLPLQYQWQYGAAASGPWSDVDGGSAATLELTNATPQQAGLYRVVVSNDAGSVTSAVRSVAIRDEIASVFTQQPIDVTTLEGAGVAFISRATGYPTPTYQWQRSADGSIWHDIAGATGRSYGFTTTAADDGARYRAVASNGRTSVASDIVEVALRPVNGHTVLASPGGADAPIDPTVANAVTVTIGGYGDAAGRDIALGVVPASAFADRATLERSDFVAWLALPGSSLSASGGFGSMLADIPAGALVAGTNYVAVAVARDGNVVLADTALDASVAIRLASDSAAAIVTAPKDAVVLPGGTTELSVAAAGSPAPTYQWESNASGSWAPVDGATASTLTVTPTATADYRVIVTNPLAIVTSDAATISVLPQPKVTVSKTEGFDPNGETITVTGTGFVPNAPATSGTRPPLAGKFTGAYVVFGKFADNWKPSTQGTGRNVIQQYWAVNPSEVATIGGVDRGALPIAADGSFTATFTIAPGALDKTGNYGIYTYAGGGAVYAPFETATLLTLTEEAPSIVTQPSDVLAPVIPATGEAEATFEVSVAGGPTPTIAWERSVDGEVWTAIEGATDSVLTLPYGAEDDGAQVRAVATSVLGAATSQSATLTVGVPAGILAQPKSTTVEAGSSATFEVAVAGDDASVQWQLKQLGAATFVDIAGETGETLEVAFEDARAGQTYRVTVDGVIPTLPGGSVFSTTSSEATLSLSAPTGAAADVDDSELTEENQGGAELVSSDGLTAVTDFGAQYAGQYVGVWLHSEPVWLGWHLADAAGHVTVTLPADVTAGEHRVIGLDATGTIIGWAAIDVTIVDPGAGSGDGSGSGDGTGTGSGSGVEVHALARTGVEPTGLLAATLLMLLLGTAALVTTRRRSRSS